MPAACQDMNTSSECLVQDITEDMGQVLESMWFGQRPWVANGHTRLLGPYPSGHMDNIIMSIIINIIVIDELLFNFCYSMSKNSPNSRYPDWLIITLELSLPPVRNAAAQITGNIYIWYDLIISYTYQTYSRFIRICRVLELALGGNVQPWLFGQDSSSWDSYQNLPQPQLLCSCHHSVTCVPPQASRQSFRRWTVLCNQQRGLDCT